MKINISINDELAKRIDNYADDNYMTRSGLIAQACNNYLIQNEALKAVKDLSLSIRRIAETGTIDKDTENKIKEFELFTKMIVGK